MPKQYLGHLQEQDPLYGILATTVFNGVFRPSFKVEKISYRQVYKYSEQNSGLAVVCKFFDPNDSNRERLARLKGEYDNLLRIRGFGFDSAPFYVVRPITKEESIGLAVVEEYIKGKDLDYYLKKAVFQSDEAPLYDRLTLLASFLWEMHRRTQTDTYNNGEASIHYIYSLIDYLSLHNVIEHREVVGFKQAVDKWVYRGILKGARDVIIHGDATPTNFIFTPNGTLAAIDMERSRYGDAAYDIGMICGELKHAFFWRVGDPLRAEPFIGHFLREYTKHSEEPKVEFRRLSMRIPFYMALTELRVARNLYLDWGYRKRLTEEARSCLLGGLKG
jgi:aminoglycoside phosphotransferase (APT) family kinase protein